MTVFSCVKDVDFEQVEEESLQITTSDLFSTSFDISTFIDKTEGFERTISLDTIHLLSDFENHLIKTQLNFNFINSLDCGFLVNFEFLNADNVLKYSLKMTVPYGSVDKPIKVETTALVEEPELHIFKEATQLAYKIKLLPKDKCLTETSDGVLELKSGITDFYH